MSRLLAALAAASILVPGTVLAAGCGAEDVEKVAGVDVAQAAQRTAAKGTARMSMTMRMSGLGLPQAVTFTAKGVTALTEPRGRISVDLSALANAFGVPVPKESAVVELLFDGADLAAKLPELPGLPALPGGASWVSLDVAQIATAMGLDTKGLGALFSIEPSAQLKVLDATKTLKKVGDEEIDGVATAHFRGTYTLEDFIDALPATEAASVREAFESIEKLEGTEGLGATLDDPVPADLWVDADGVARRVRTSSTLPAQNGMPGGTMVLSYDLTDFGAKLDTTPPPAGDTYDATSALSGLLKQSLAVGAGTQIG